MTCPIYIYSILFSLLPPLFILGANGKVFFSMSITKTKKCHREMHAHVVCVFFYRFNYKNPQHNFHSETTHIIYVYTQQYLSSRKHQYAIIFHSLKAYCGQLQMNRLLHFMFFLTNTFCWCIYIKGKRKKLYECVLRMCTHFKLNVSKWLSEFSSYFSSISPFLFLSHSFRYRQ